MNSFRAFFGDRERTFRIAGPHIAELEAKTGAGIGTLIQRVASRDVWFRDVSEIIRIGLIGGGAEPAEAARLVETYVIPMPLEPSLYVAIGIVGALWEGVPKTEVTPDEPA